MTEIRYTVKDGEHMLCVSGHAGYSNRGNDIVCAAISAISYALLGFLENNEDDEPSFSYKTGDGELIVFSNASERVDAAFETTLIGYRQIAQKYPQYVDVYISAFGGDSRE